MDIPQILQQLNGSQTVSSPVQAMLPQINQAKQAMKIIQSARNPQVALQQILQSNPKYAEAMNIINSFNGDINGAISALCARKGINPQEFIEALK